MTSIKRILYLAVITTFFLYSVEALASKPTPKEPSSNDVGHFCKMIVVNHTGPKGQIFIEGEKDVLWFSTIRDLFSYILLPEEVKRISAIYVNDMGVASWDAPEAGSWVDAYLAHYVIGSRKKDGMGGKSIVPFASKSKAKEFVKKNGGKVVGFSGISKEDILHSAH